MAANVKNLPLSVIFAAKSGDGQALGAVLNHYQRYIRSLATRTLTDECGAKTLLSVISINSLSWPIISVGSIST